MGWIGVKDSMPGDFQRVLTSDAFGNMHIMTHNYLAQYPFNIDPNHSRYYSVTHWMPLPTPPNEAESR